MSRSTVVRLVFGGFALVVCFVRATCPGSALAVENYRPVITEVSATEATEHGIRLSASIDPKERATSYEFIIECRTSSMSVLECDPESGPIVVAKGRIEADVQAQKIVVSVTGLEAGSYYRYEVIATNSAGETRKPSNLFITMPSCSEGCGPTEPYKTEISPGSEEQAKRYGEEGSKRQTEREQAEREAAERNRPAPAPESGARAGAEVNESYGRERGRLKLVAHNVRVRAGVVALAVRCKGESRCAGVLELLAAAGPRHAGRRGSVVIAGTARYSISAGRRATVHIRLDSAGRGAVERAHGRLAAMLVTKSPKSRLGKVMIAR